VDRATLEQMLGRGLSLAEIGRRVGRHESTVGYWLQRYGLEAVGRDKHGAKGGLTREQLEPLVRAGMSIAEIAQAVGRSKAGVRHWLTEYRLQTAQAERKSLYKTRKRRLTLVCSRHGETDFQRRSGGGYRCLKCRSEAVSRRRRRVKEILVADAGGACQLCGYDACIAALEFHHLDPAVKRFSLSHRGVARSLEKARAEASKCALLCANCHAAVEVGALTLGGPEPAHVQSTLIPRQFPG
jgi:transposase